MSTSLGLSLTRYPQLNAWNNRLNNRPSWQQTQSEPQEIETFKETMQKLMAGQN
jgi:glutathione S-transferase